MILVTGAAGKTGRAVIRSLVDRGLEVRALVHRAEQADEATRLGAAEFVVADLTDSTALRSAMLGVDAVYLICPNVHPGERAIGQVAVASAEDAGVRRFIYHSVHLPDIEAMPHHWQKHLVEQDLSRSSLDYSILRPCAYMENITGGWRTIMNEGIYEVPYDADARLSLVHLADVAEAATAVIRESGHSGASYALCGRETTPREVASELGDILGRQVRVSVVTAAEWADTARERGFGAYAVEALCQMFEYYDRHGFTGTVDDLERILGRPATSLRDFLASAVGDPEGPPTTIV